MQYFTYGKLQDQVQEESDPEAAKKKIKPRQRKNAKSKGLLGRNERRASRIYNTVDAKCISDATSRRK